MCIPVQTGMRQNRWNMRFIGITGGVGAGKTEILQYIEREYPAYVLLADRLAHELMQPETACYQEIQLSFPSEDIYLPDGGFDAGKLAEVIFSDEKKREKLNGIVHPAVKREILRRVEAERQRKKFSYFILEAALLIEEGYDKICDELWYIDTSRTLRRERLKKSRGYSDEKIDAVFDSQLSEREYRKRCTRRIDNNGSLEETFRQIRELFEQLHTAKTIGGQGDEKMEKREIGGDLVFGLDIGTRNVVGTVGYKIGKEFVVMAQRSLEHETRAMMDGQIHDIGRVGNTIRQVKESLEEQTGQTLTSVCIAAAGRVLKTVTVNIEYEYEMETVVTAEDVHTLDLLGIEKAQSILKEENDTGYKFYCVGYSVIRYYLNDDIFASIEGHKADKIAEDIIVTFLPEDVIDGLYAAVQMAGLSVANLTLEPIAAINIAIPENFRMLNIALVDIGAGTSDISVARDGSIIAYGMIPLAGDEITELIAQNYLVDFQTAEQIKLASTTDDEIEYTDIMQLKYTIPAEEVWKLTEDLVDNIATDIANKIIELNGERSVKAVFIVGGGGKIHGFETMLADKLKLPHERVALRGEEVLQSVSFEQPDAKKDPLLVTPIGICLNYYEQKNSFVMVHFNGERIKLYDNDRLTIVDAALQAGFPNEYLFPRRGREIHFTVNGSPRIARGEAGESAIVKVNDKLTNINAPLLANSYITVEPSTVGKAAEVTIADITDDGEDDMNFIVNGANILCPKFVEVNGNIELLSYEVQEGDVIETRSFYTIRQLAEFMDVAIDLNHAILVNNRPANMDTLVYENFTIDWVEEADIYEDEDFFEEEEEEPVADDVLELEEEQEPELEEESFAREKEVKQDAVLETQLAEQPEEFGEAKPKEEEQPKEEDDKTALRVMVNGAPIRLTGKPDYIFVDIFDFIDFDLKASNGRPIVIKVNGEYTDYVKQLHNGDAIEIYWEEK